MSSTKLKNAPLKEVIFEVHWDGVSDQNGTLRDAGFDLAQGKLAERLKVDFPLHRKLLPDSAPISFFRIPKHQYWTGELNWPVVQHGEGILTVNEVEVGYEWENRFKPLVLGVIDKTKEAYENNIHFKSVKLQYIDAWDLENQSFIDFIGNNLQTFIKIGYQEPGKLKNVNIHQSFELTDASIFQLNIYDAYNNKTDQKSIVWTTTVEKSAAFNDAELIDWLEGAHQVTSDFFKKMLSKDFYDSLDR